MDCGPKLKLSILTATIAGAACASARGVFAFAEKPESPVTSETDNSEILVMRFILFFPFPFFLKKPRLGEV
jgi:hypothetical protein